MSSCTQSAKNTDSRMVSSRSISCNYGLLTDGEAEAPQGTCVTQGSSSLPDPELSSHSALQQGKHLSPVRSRPIQEAGHICTSVVDRKTDAAGRQPGNTNAHWLSRTTGF